MTFPISQEYYFIIYGIVLEPLDILYLYELITREIGLIFAINPIIIEQKKILFSCKTTGYSLRF